MIPTVLLTRQRLPSPALLRPYPRLHRLFNRLSVAIRTGSLASFDATLAEGESEFVKRRIYLTLERGREICLRNLLRKVYLAAGTDENGKRHNRIPIDEFGAAIRLGESHDSSGESVDLSAGMERLENDRLGESHDSSGENVDLNVRTGRLENDEVECMISHIIYKVLSFSICIIANAHKCSIHRV